MADLAITASLVKKGVGAQVNSSLLAGAVITAGSPVYLDTTAGTVKLTDANVAAASLCDGISLHAAEIGQPISFITSGALFEHGLTGVVAGDVLYASETVGRITKLFSDIASASTVITLGIATSATVAKVQIQVAGAVKA